MFDTDTTYPTDGLLIGRPIHEDGLAAKFDGRRYALATAAHSDATSDVPLGRVHRTQHNGHDYFRLDDRQSYSYRYFRGVTLNTLTPEGMPVMLLGPLDVDLPWLVGKVLAREGTERVTVAPLWGPPGAALPAVANGDAWARVAAIPPQVMLWHPDDDEAAALAKQEARNVWLRWHVAWLALLGETVTRDWGSILRQIAEGIDYTPEPVTWRGQTRASYSVVLTQGLTEDNYASLRRALSLPEGADVPSAILAARVEEPVSFTVQAAIPEEDELDDLDARVRNALHEMRPGVEYIDHGGVDLTPSYL